MRTLYNDNPIADRAGNILDGEFQDAFPSGDGQPGGDFVAKFDVLLAVVSVDLQAASDSGKSNSDNITNIVTPAFDVTVNKKGTIEVDFDADGTFDSSLSAPEAGTFAFPATPPLTDGVHLVEARFTPWIGDSVSASLAVTIDTWSPEIINAIPLPDEGESVTAVIDGLTIEASKPLSPSGVNDPASWELRGAGPDETFVTADDLLYPLSTNPEYLAGRTIALDIASPPLPPDQYRLTAFASVVTDIAGNPLDGDGNGAGGDDYVRTFQVANAGGVVIEAEPNDSRGSATPLPWRYR